ncbi:two-component response regulator-like APRR1 isoform X1 [Salvia hispanica]|uniref:two-component response regulator-like APRR1 isoform X1 n=1 Tax=Salvia hispanica TaxID=49212 RepID=UPI00200974B8|nr:two-component response regulator-like APRR1 isoform X1 [Salvia hispanica]
MEKSEMGKTGDGFIDRSKVRILLCDNDVKSSEEVFTLLCKCSYQVTAVKSPRQVIDALNAEGPDIDIILSEVDLPMSKGLKMLKYIMRDKELRRIPVIMMSAQDEVPLVVKCLKFGAADYLVKPLRTNELLNLWTHMWRRRRMLGLVEKNIISYDFDLVVSDHSDDANTNSTTLFSDDTDDKSRKSTNPEMCVSTHQEDEIDTTTTAPIATVDEARRECQPDVPGISDRRTYEMRIGQILPFLRKNEFKIGESSAFFTYVKSSISKSTNHGSSSVPENTAQHVSFVENHILNGEVGFSIEAEKTILNGEVDLSVQREKTHETLENQLPPDEQPSSSSAPESFIMDRSCTPPKSLDISQQRNSKEFSQEHMHLGNDSPNDVTGSYPYPYYMSGVANQVPMSSASMYPKINHDISNRANSALIPQYNHVPQCPPHIPGMASYPYYPYGICLQPGQMPSPHPWPSFGNSTSSEVKLSKVDRREAALLKFRQKRKERCFDKKIRYVNRKKLAERRPRVRGQFVRKVNGVDVDLNGQPEDDEEEGEEYDEDDQTANMELSHEDGVSMCQ